MSTDARPAITPTEISQGFWDSCAEGRLVVQKCVACSQLRHYPQSLCPSCHSNDVVWEEIGHSGTIYSYTIARRPFHKGWKDKAPYALVIVDMDAGVRMMGDILNVDPDAVKIGDRVSVQFESMSGQGVVPRFCLSG